MGRFHMPSPNTRYQLVWNVMQDGKWHTLKEISEKSGFGEASVSAQLRDYRKPQFGKHQVLKRAAHSQTHAHEKLACEYRLIPNRVVYDEEMEQFVYRESA